MLLGVYVLARSNADHVKRHRDNQIYKNESQRGSSMNTPTKLYALIAAIAIVIAGKWAKERGNARIARSHSLWSAM